MEGPRLARAYIFCLRFDFRDSRLTRFERILVMFRRSPLCKTALITLTLLASFIPALAAGPVFWEISKQEDIAKGDAQGVSIAENGAITLAPSFALVYDTKEAYIWSSAADAAGNIYLGTGHEGRIFKVEPSGQGRLLYDAGELDVTALTTDPQGNLYAGTSPEGKVYKIGPDGRESVLYDPPDKYIWSLAFDPASSTLYAGTGDKGIIYRIDQTGKASVLADTNETNIVSLAVNKGNLLAGTDPSGLVLRVSPDGKTFALFDSPSQEIHSLSVADDGSVFALGINQQGGAGRQLSSGVSSTTSVSGEGVITISTDDSGEAVSSSVQSADISGLLNQGQSRSRKADGARSAVFRILAEGGSEVYWSAPNAVGFALKSLPGKGVLVGTGDKGRIYSVAPDRSDLLMIQSPEDQTSTIIAVGDNLFATSSNLGRLYRIGRQSVNEGRYTSPIHDAKFAAGWGVITWRGTGNVELQTRSGNTESPDATWSDWSAPYRNAAGDQVTSPRARFIQWRATLRNAANQAAQGAAQLQTVVVAYLPRNQAPEIASVSVLAPGVALQEMPLAIDPSIASSGLDPQLFGVVANVPPRRFFQKGARSLSWTASDPNDDTLFYTLMYRTVGDNQWHMLAENISQPYYTIDGNRLPDGSYLFKVQASDAPGNPAGLALTHEKATDAVEIDNTPPSIKVSGPVLNGPATEVTFDVSDTTSRVVRGEYSVDGGQWLLIFPADGIADSSRESYKVRVTFDKPGEHVIAFRCADSSSNVGTSKVTLTAR
jgi:WD40 repeat protein